MADDNPKAKKKPSLRSKAEGVARRLGNKTSALFGQAVEGVKNAASGVRGAFRPAPETTTRFKASGIGGGPTSGINVTQEVTPEARNAPKVRGLQGLKNFGKGVGANALVGAAQAGRVEEAATQPVANTVVDFLRTNPISAPFVNIADKSIRLAQGQGGVRAAVEPFASGLSATTGGLSDALIQPDNESPLELGGPTPLQLGRRALGIPEPAPATPGGLRGLTPGGAPAPQFEEDLTQTVNTGTADVADPRQVGVRKFNNDDAIAAAQGIDPASRRGSASVEENQSVLDRLLARNAQLRQAGLAAAPQPAGTGGQAQADPAATRLAQSGGLASAFGALALSGNQLRREAADRTRAADRAEAVQESDLKLRNKLTEIGATSQVDRQKNFAKNTVSLAESFNEALESGSEEQVANVRSSIFQSALQDPNGEAAAAASSVLAQDITDNTETTFFGALFSINPFTGGRGFSDAIVSLLGQGGLNNEFQQAINKLTLNEATGDLTIASPDGSGTPQFVVNIKDLSAESRNYISQGGLRQTGAGQQITRGDPNIHAPSRPSLRSGQQ